MQPLRAKKCARIDVCQRNVEAIGIMANWWNGLIAGCTLASPTTGSFKKGVVWRRPPMSKLAITNYSIIHWRGTLLGEAEVAFGLDWLP
jgi:hypothetical protein